VGEGTLGAPAMGQNLPEFSLFIFYEDGEKRRIRGGKAPASRRTNERTKTNRRVDFSLPLIVAPVYGTHYPFVSPLAQRFFCVMRDVEWSVGGPRAATFAGETLHQCNQSRFVRT
jgi:hypothetical protein